MFIGLIKPSLVKCVSRSNVLLWYGVAFIVLLIIGVALPSPTNTSVPASTEVQSQAPAMVEPVISTTPVIKKIVITEKECLQLKDEFYSLIMQQPFQKTTLGKEILEQYAKSGGIPVKMSNPYVSYTLPDSDCGMNLDTALKVIITGEKKAMQLQ